MGSCLSRGSREEDQKSEDYYFQRNNRLVSDDNNIIQLTKRIFYVTNDKENLQKGLLTDRGVEKLKYILISPYTEDITTRPINFKDLTNYRLKFGVYCYVLYRLKYTLKVIRVFESDLKKLLVSFGAIMAKIDEKFEANAGDQMTQKDDIQIDFQISILYYASLGLLDQKASLSYAAAILQNPIQIMPAEIINQFKDLIDEIWTIFKHIINSKAFNIALKLFTFAATGNLDKLEDIQDILKVLTL